MRRWVIFLILIVTVLIGILLTLVSCKKQSDYYFSGSGILEAKEVLVSAKMAGELLSLNVNEGDMINKNQLIAQIDTEKVVLQKKQLLAGFEELKLNMENGKRIMLQAKENFGNTQKKYDRMKSLHNQGSVTQQQYDDVDTGLKAVKTQYENARTNLAVMQAKENQLSAQLGLIESQYRDTRITSPITGTVIEKYIEYGELVRPGSPVVTIADLSQMSIKVYVTEKILIKIQIGSSAELSISSYPGKKFPCKIVWISPKAEFTPKNIQTQEARADLVYAVKVVVENPEGILKIGMPADVIFH
jgi:HlyD family secretion protein